MAPSMSLISNFLADPLLRTSRAVRLAKNMFKEDSLGVDSENVLETVDRSDARRV